ncbi:MAG: hypothetical protein U1D30_09700 [Planctomycetota bacterium]
MGNGTTFNSSSLEAPPSHAPAQDSSNTPLTTDPIRNANGLVWLKHLVVLFGILTVYYGYFHLLSTYSGWLGWDDANRLYSTLLTTRNARSAPIPLPLAYLESISHTSPEPPLLNFLFGVIKLAFPSLSTLTVLYICTYGIFVLQAFLVFLVTARLTSVTTAYFAILCLLSSDINTTVGLLFISEMLLSILFLLTAWTCVREALAPAWHREMLLGAILGFALLDKASTPVLFGIPYLMTLVRVADRAGPWAAWRYLCLSSVAALAISLPWYVPNFTPILNHLRIVLNTTGLYTGVEPPTTTERLLAHALLVAGLPTCFCILYAFPRFQQILDKPGYRREEFHLLATMGLSTGGFLVLFSLPVIHFEARYFHVAMPVLAITAAPILRHFVNSRSLFARVFSILVLLAGVAFSNLLVTSASVFFTDWTTIPFLEKLKSQKRVTTVAFVGNSGDWNLGKLQMLNEMTKDPASRNIYALTDPYLNVNWRASLEGIDYILVLYDFNCEYNSEHRLIIFNQEYQNIVNMLNSPESPFERVEIPLLYVPERLWLFQRKTADVKSTLGLRYEMETD